MRPGEGIAGVARRPESRAADHRESIEQFEAHLQRQLLARERVDNSFEHRRKPGRLHASECVGERPQPRITRGHVVPVGQIDSKPEQPINDRSHPSSLQQRPRRWRCRHDQPRRGRRARLPHGEFGRPSSEHDHTSIGGAIPAVDQVARTAPQRPHREIEAERRNWSQHERQSEAWPWPMKGLTEPIAAAGASASPLGLRRPARLLSQVLLQGDRIVVLRVM